MSTHNICFRGEIRKIFTGYPPLFRPMMFSTPDYGLLGSGLDSSWRWNSSYDCMGLHCAEPFIAPLPSSPYDLTLVLLNLDMSFFANSVDPDQLASEEAN